MDCEVSLNNGLLLQKDLKVKDLLYLSDFNLKENNMERPIDFNLEGVPYFQMLFTVCLFPHFLY